MSNIKQGYKQTDIGVIPEDWKVKRVDQCVKLINGRAYKQEELLLNGKYPVLRVGNFFSNNSWYYSDLELNEDQYVNDGDLMYAWSASFGPRFWKGSKTIYHYHIWKVLANKEISKQFLFYLWEFDKEKILKQSQGGTMFHITKFDMGSRKIGLPSELKEQTAIATALSDTDALIAALDKKIAKKQQIKQGAMQQLLTGKKRLPGFSGEWVEKTIWEIAKKNKTRLNDGDWIESPYITNDGIRLVQTGNIGIGLFKDKAEKKFISEESFNKLNCKEILPNDILICRLAEPAGRTCIAPKSPIKMITSVDVSIFRPNEEFYDRSFLLYVLNTPEWFREINDRCGGSTRTRIARMQLGSICINIPENKSEQTAIAQILTDMDNEITQLEKERDKYKELKAGMMQVLLTGKVRLV